MLCYIISEIELQNRIEINHYVHSGALRETDELSENKVDAVSQLSGSLAASIINKVSLCQKLGCKMNDAKQTMTIEYLVT